MGALGSEEQPKVPMGKYFTMLQEIANLQRTAITIELDDLIEVNILLSLLKYLNHCYSLMRIMMIWLIELLGIQVII